MKHTYSVSLERLEHEHSDEIYRAYVWKTLHFTQRPVTVIHDCGEGTLVDLLGWFTEEHGYVTCVRMSDGTLEEPDCLSVWEAAEAAAL
jgi:hypothetical protein